MFTKLQCFIFLPVGTQKSLVYPIAKEETLYQLIFHSFLTFCNFSGVNEIVRKSIIRRVHACSDLGGGYFEHLL